MKKLLALLMVMAFMFGMPMFLSAGDEHKSNMVDDMAKGTEDFGHNFFMYLGGLVEYPVHVLEQGVRTLLFMDKE